MQGSFCQMACTSIRPENAQVSYYPCLLNRQRLREYVNEIRHPDRAAMPQIGLFAADDDDLIHCPERDFAGR